jgi:hypothetical protein
MSTKRNPLLSDEECHTFAMESIGPIDAAEMVRDHYEHLIDDDKLRVVEEVDLDAGRGHSFIRGIYRPCIMCKTKVYNGDVYCSGCGNKIKRP